MALSGGVTENVEERTASSSCSKMGLVVPVSWGRAESEG